MRYEDQYQSWRNDPQKFWADQVQNLQWQTAPEKIFEHNESGDRWYVDGVMNSCFNCVDRHVEAGHGARIAFIHDSPITGTKSQISYAELLDRVQCVASMMQDKGIKKGDRVAAYIPNNETAVIAMLATASLGAIFSSCSPAVSYTHLTLPTTERV